MNERNSKSNDELKVTVHGRLLERLDLQEARHLPVEQLYQECSRQIDLLLTEMNRPLSGPEKAQLIREVLDDVFGLGPIEEFLRDPQVSDILVNGSDQIYIEKAGVLHKTNARFRDSEQVLQVIQRIAAQVGRRIDESSPMLDARLRDGSRVNAIIPPLSLTGPTLSVRRFGTIKLDTRTMVEAGSLTEDMAKFLQACVSARLNVVISGGTGSGKTTLLNMLSRWIPNNDRVITIEDAAELQLQQEHVVRLETRPNNVEGKGEVTQRSLLKNSLRMRPDRIIIGEVRGAEALDMLQAMNTGHEGSMTTVHANSPRDAFMRLENMVSMGGLNFPIQAIRQQMTSAIDILIHLSRLTGGHRKVVYISEVTNMEGEMVLMQDIFRFRQTGLGPEGHAKGHFEVCGIRPGVLARIEAEGITFPDGFFQQRTVPNGPIHVNGKEVQRV
jgi:pilus assembly protein CpaF